MINIDSRNPFVQPDGTLAKYGVDTFISINQFVETNKLVIKNPRVPATATAPGAPGQIAWDANFLYVCIDNAVWKRVAISTW